MHSAFEVSQAEVLLDLGPRNRGRGEVTFVVKEFWVGRKVAERAVPGRPPTETFVERWARPLPVKTLSQARSTPRSRSKPMRSSCACWATPMPHVVALQEPASVASLASAGGWQVQWLQT